MHPAGLEKVHEPASLDLSVPDGKLAWLRAPENPDSFWNEQAKAQQDADRKDAVSKQQTELQARETLIKHNHEVPLQARG